MVKNLGFKGLVKDVLFYGTFMVSVIPLWFVLFAAFFNHSISTTAAFYIILVIIVCRGYMESEIIDGGVILLSSMQIVRILAKIVLIFLIYGMFIYILFFANPIDHILIASATLIAVLVFFNTESGKRENRALFYLMGYRLNGINSLLVLFLWLYICFIPDSIFGNLLAICGIYLIEFNNLFKNYVHSAPA